jgi:hypothetical protein
MPAGAIYACVVGTIAGVLCIVEGISGKPLLIRRRPWWMPTPMYRVFLVLSGTVMLGAIGARLAGVW